MKSTVKYIESMGIALIVIFLTGCASSKTSLNSEIKELRPGVLAGYLNFKDLPVSVALLPPPPVEGTIAHSLDEELMQKTLKETDSARWKQAIIDAELTFPSALKSFEGIVDVSISEENTPNLYILLRRCITDISYSTYTAKKHYQRKRPFMLNEKPTCTPDIEEHLREGGSYPSGHTAIGWAWALILTEVFPKYTNQLIERGREYGESRMVCNLHWQSDIDAGRFMGAATLARLHASSVFQADLLAAKKEVSKLRK